MMIKTSLETPLLSLKGVGPKISAKLEKLNLYTIHDLLLFFPFRYQNRKKITPISQLIIDSEALIKAKVAFCHQPQSTAKRGKKTILCELEDEWGYKLNLRFFHFSQAQLIRYTEDQEVLCYGQVKYRQTGLEMAHPEVLFIEGNEEINLEYRPVYHLTEGLSQRNILELLSQSLTILKQVEVQEYLPEQTIKQYHFQNFKSSIKLIHKPDDAYTFEQLEANNTPLYRRLVFEELVAHQINVLEKQQNNLKKISTFQTTLATNHLINLFTSQLPFELTEAQNKVVKEIQLDLRKTHPMQRLLQGDVGSGKTVVSAIAILYAIEQGFQGCLMAPTGLLAEQHYYNFKTWFDELDIRVDFLTGKIKGKQRKKVLIDLKEGKTQVLIGTHALFQEQVEFSQLGLIVIDEQHRFGVDQRFKLKNKGLNSKNNQIIEPHTLVMTATPIPRTLAMTAYADLCCSIIDELPPGRQAIDTVVIPEQRRDEIIQRIYLACQHGKQAYWICTLVEESEILQCQAAETTFSQLQSLLQGVNVGLVHGQMNEQEKQAIMLSFKSAKIQLLVATTVVEVGVDVPNASLMIIENSERLGLSQLHQLRGRVGRGSEKSACVLMYDPSISKQSEKRLKIIRGSNDGFVIAEEDLKLRGPGEILGTRQTGYAKLLIANIIRDRYLIADAQKVALSLLTTFPEKAHGLMQRWIGRKKQYEQV